MLTNPSHYCLHLCDTYIPMACAYPSIVHAQFVKQSLKVNAAHFDKKKKKAAGRSVCVLLFL